MKLTKRLGSVVPGVLGGIVILAVIWRISVQGRLPTLPEGFRPVAVDNWRIFSSSGARLGGDRGPVTIVVFSDYLCPACKQADTILQSLIDRYSPSLTVVYRHFPFQAQSSFQAAWLAECARRSGQFGRVHQELFRHADSLGLVPWDTVTVRASVEEPGDLVECMVRPDIAAFVLGELEAGASLGVTGTPSLLVDSLFFNGFFPDERYLEAYVTKALQATN